MRHRRRKLRGRELKKQRKMIIISVFALFLSLSIGYAAFQTVIKINVKGNIKIDEECVVGKVWEFEQKDEAQEFRVPCSGEYKVELWGAQGGNADITEGGLGGYTSGKIQLNKRKNLYLYVGSKGTGGNNSVSKYAGGYNGGGSTDSQANYANRYFASGGGSTDVRLIKSLWNDFDSLKSRIMVSAASGGSYYDSSVSRGFAGGAAGGLTGYAGYQDPGSVWTSGIGGTQTSSGYSTCLVSYCGKWSGTVQGGNYGYGRFGEGGISVVNLSGAGGAGYYGGGAGIHIDAGGGGGSSFISGHDGCDAINENSTSDNIVHTGQSIHYSGLKFIDTVMIDGAGCRWTTVKTSECIGMPTHDGNSTMTGNVGDGFAKITLLTKKTN